MSSAGSSRRFSMKQPVLIADVGFGCGCRWAKLTALLSALRPKPRCPKTVPHSLSSSSSAAATSLWASATMKNSSFSSDNEESASPPPQKKKEQRRRRGRGMRKPAASAAAESQAVVKESSEPYADFRESMVQMIVEKELYAWNDLNDLLHRFLSLNSPRHHHLILRAFADLWSPPSPYCLRKY